MNPSISSYLGRELGDSAQHDLIRRVTDSGISDAILGLCP